MSRKNASPPYLEEFFSDIPFYRTHVLEWDRKTTGRATRHLSNMGINRGQTGGVHPKNETEIMVTVLDEENRCHRRKRSSSSTERS
jgi:hypothetical protein